jgi:hypothetical protein
MLPGEKLYLVEGEFDRNAVMVLGYNSLGIPGAGNIPAFKEFRRLLPFEIVYTGDNDAAGRKLLTGNYTDNNGNQKYSDHNLKSIFKRLDKQLKIKQLPNKDANEFLMNKAI